MSEDEVVDLTPLNAGSYLGRECDVELLGGGVSNTVLLVTTTCNKFVLKQSLQKLRVEQDWFSDRARIFRESAALRALGSLLPAGSAPEVLFEDRKNYCFAMSAAPAGAETWKSQLLRGIIREETAERVACILGTMISRSWEDADLAARFGDQTVFDQLRLDPYYRTTARRHPDLASHFEQLIEQCGRRRVSLVHGDWSPKNFLIAGDRVMAIDFEVIHFGDPTFDAGFLLNHLLLKSLYMPDRDRQLKSAARRFWQVLTPFIPWRAEWFERSTLAHLGGLLLARIDGKSPVEYITDAALKDRIRQIARGMILHPPRSVLEVFS